MSFQIGQRIGDYQVIDTLGAGGMGKVYKVKNVFSERIEALKILLPNLTSDPELADRFVREIKVQASLEHPNIAGLRTAQQVENQLVMIVEFVDGVSLEQMMRQGPVPLPTAIECVSQVLSALIYAHAHGIIHRDIKPANIMVTHSGVVKLMDFGIAKAVADRRLTQTGRTVGSLFYMSPEQIQGSPNIDGRADLYSLGITLYELITGRRPFQGDSDYSIMAAHLTQAPVPPIQLDSKVPAALSEVILQSISKDPARRFQSAAAFQTALGSIAPKPAPAVVASPAPPPEAQVKPGSSRRALYMVVGSLITVAALAFAAFQLPRHFRAAAGPAQPVPRNEPAVQSQPPLADARGSEPMSRPLVRTIPSRDNLPDQGPAREGAVVKSEPTQQVQATPPPQPVRQTEPETSPPARVQMQPPFAKPAPDAAALEELSNRFNLLATRVNTARAGLKRLEEAQARMGLGLRGDMTTAASRMTMFMDQAESASRAGDSAAFRKAMDSSERELERIEKVIEGR